jgi:hypothetical protein
MSDRIYSDNSDVASENWVTVCEAIGGNLTKINYANGRQKPYDHVKFFNLFEYPLTNLHDLYVHSVSLITQHNCCFVRARIRDENKVHHVVRKTNSEEATLVMENFNWVPLDIDWTHPSSGNLLEDAETTRLALPPAFHGGIEYYAVASASYGFKPGIRMRLFFWNKHPVSNVDIKNYLADYKRIADPAIYNPAQPIYTSEPIGVNNVKQRIAWYTPFLSKKELIIPITDHQNMHGAPEKWYTKNRADLNLAAHYGRISMLPIGDRHNGLIDQCLPIGKLVGQGHFEREVIIDELMVLLDKEWAGKRDIKKDRETVAWAVDKGIAAMERGRNV